MKQLLAVIPMLFAAHASAGVLSYSLTDIGSFSGTKNTDITSTYAGTGYLGMYNNAWGHLFGAERSNQSRTLMQVDIGALAGKSITSAFLTFDLKDGDTGTQAGTLVGFDAGSGQLAYGWNAPTENYGAVAASLVGRAANSIDITSLLAASVGAQDSWFGMHLKGSTRYQWSVANSGSYGPDRANVRLTVNYEDAAQVPEPSTALLAGLGLLALVIVINKASLGWSTARAPDRPGIHPSLPRQACHG